MAKLGRPRVLDGAKRSMATMMRGWGVPLEEIARRLGCAPCTLRREMQREQGFRQEMNEARLGGDAEMLWHIVRASVSQPGAARWLRKKLVGDVDQAPGLLSGRGSERAPTSGSTIAQKSPIVQQRQASSSRENPSAAALPIFPFEKNLIHSAQTSSGAAEQKAEPPRRREEELI